MKRLPEENNNQSLVLTPSEVRRILRCSKAVVYDSLRRGIIPSIRIGQRKIVIPRARFMSWLNDTGGDGATAK